MERRSFMRIGAGALAPAGQSASIAAPGGIAIGDRFSPDPSEKDFAIFKQSGVEYATVWTTIDKVTLDYMKDMRRLVTGWGMCLRRSRMGVTVSGAGVRLGRSSTRRSEAGSRLLASQGAS